MLIAILVALMLAPTCLAETGAIGHVFGAPGLVVVENAGVFHAGGGGEALLYKGLGIGADLGYVFPFEYPSQGLGVFSPGASYHFKRDRLVSPFVTGGYTLAFRSQAFHAAHVGAGFHYWLSQGLGLRFEIRDHFRPDTVYQILSFRFGLSFR